MSYTAGVIQLTATTGDIAEGSNLYFTDARAQGAISVTGAGLSYAAGVIQLTADTGDIAEGSNLYFTDARAKNAITIKPVTGPDIQLLKKEVNGDLSVQLSDIFAEFSAGLGLKWDGAGVFELDATSDDIGEGLNNLFYKDSRARGAISADPAAGNLVQYNAATGEILVALSSLRKTFAPQNLTANTFATLNHNL